MSLTITATGSPDSNFSFTTVSSPTESFVSQADGGFPPEGEPAARAVPATQVITRDEAEGVGLSDPQHASARRRMLDVINALHLTGYDCNGIKTYGPWLTLSVAYRLTSTFL